MPAIEIRNISKGYKKNKFCLQIDHLLIDSGSIFGILGPNGAGKTTLFKLLMDISRPDRGSIEILGHTSGQRSNLIPDVAYMPENKNLYPNMKVGQMLDFAGRIMPGWDNDRARELTELFPLNNNKKISTLSYGEKTRLYSIITFARTAELYILDEPTRGLDPLMQERVLTLIKEQSLQGKTVVFSSHQLEEIEETADSVSVIQNGRICLSGNLDDIRADHFMIAVDRKHLNEVINSGLETVSIKNNSQNSVLLCRTGTENNKYLQDNYDFIEQLNMNFKDIYLHLVDNGGEMK